MTADVRRRRQRTVYSPHDNALRVSRAKRIPSDLVERILLWAFVAGLAWCPFWFGSNVPLAWGINAVLFPGLVAIYEASLLIRGESSPGGGKTNQAAGRALCRCRALGFDPECDMDAGLDASSDMANDRGRVGQDRLQAASVSTVISPVWRS